MKKRTSFALSDECMKILRELKGKWGISMASVIEYLVRKAGKEKNV